MPNEAEAVGARELDALYQKTDKIYYEFARGCGLSETAYWILYAVEVSGGSVAQRVISEEFSYSKQTVNSALKALEALPRAAARRRSSRSRPQAAPSALSVSSRRSRRRSAPS